MGMVRMGRSLRAAMVLGCLACVVLLAPASVSAKVPEYLKSFGPDGTEASGFGKAAAIAVDEGAGVVYVIDHEAGSLLKFDLEGQPVDFGGSAPYISGNQITELSMNPVTGKTQVAVDQDSHAVYVTSGNAITAFEADGDPAEFTAGPGAGTNAIGGFVELTGLAVDENGTIYASDIGPSLNSGLVKLYGHDGEAITQFFEDSLLGPTNLAVDSNGNVYVNVWQTRVNKYVPSAFPVTGATVYEPPTGPFTAAGSYSVAVDPTTNDVYVTQTTPGIARYNESGELLETFAQAGEEGELFFSEGLAVDGPSKRVFASDAPAEGLSQVEIFQYVGYLGPPLVETVSTTQVGSNSAVLRAEINPGGFETTYRFEYGPEDCSVSVCTSIPVGGESIGDGDQPVLASQAISGLLPETTYHYRVAADNEEGDEVGPAAGDHVFTTQTGALGFQLSDSRAWEMVSPPNKHGGVLVSSVTGLIQAAEDGEGLAYISKGPILAEAEGNRTPERVTTLARRGGSGWTSENIMPPNDQVVPIVAGMQGEYKLFSSDLGRALVEPLSFTPLSPQASERTPYLRTNGNPPLYTPLVTGKEGFSNVAPGTKFGGAVGAPPVEFIGSTPSLDYIVLGSTIPLLEPESPSPSLYEWAGGQLQPVSVLPESEGGAMTSARMVGSGLGSVQHAISDDGSRVFWSTGLYAQTTGNNLTALYMRDISGEETARLDVVAGGSGAGAARPVFQGADPEGTVAFFTDSQQLTEGASPSGFDLYRCEIPAGSPAGCATLTNLTAPGEGKSAEVQGVLPGLSDDASTLYFVARGVLDGAPNGEGESSVPGEPNLYFWSESGGTRFIATLAPEDAQSWGSFKGSVGVKTGLSAGSSPSGRYLAFMSERNLTGYDNREAASGTPAQEVFRYDALTDRLDCVSCNPSSGAPIGFLDFYNLELPLVDPRERWSGQMLAANLPQPATISLAGPTLYQPRFMLDNGRVFFNAFDALVAGDSNGEWDVYQYEPDGVGDCSPSSGSAATSRAAGGCVSLMSSGTAEEEAALLDTSASGNDVFFLSSDRLAATDMDSELDVYDARVNGVVPAPPLASPCVGESCRVLAMPPPAASPGSASFTGAGNLKQSKRCPKGKRRVKQGGRARCVPRKHKKPPRKSSSNRSRGR